MPFDEGRSGSGTSEAGLCVAQVTIDGLRSEVETRREQPGDLVRSKYGKKVRLLQPTTRPQFIVLI